jgi:hypothetical protein
MTTHAAGTTTAPSATTVEQCKGSKSAAVRARAVRRLENDLAALRRVAAVHTRWFDGPPALSRGVDRFLLDVATPEVSVFVRNRFIDRAAGLVAPLCDQCFQALEASRPIASGAKMSCG